MTPDQALKFCNACVSTLGSKTSDKVASLAATVSPEINVNQRLVNAVYRGSYSDVQIWLKAGGDPNCVATFREKHDPTTPLIAALVKLDEGRYAIAKLLLSAEANPDLPDPQGRTPLFWSSQFSFEITRLLLEHKANPRIRTQKAVSAIEAVQGRIKNEELGVYATLGDKVFDWKGMLKILQAEAKV